MKQNPFGRIAVLVVSMAVAVSACGDDAATTSSTQPASPTTTAASSTTTPAPSTTGAVVEETESVTVFFSTGDGSDCSQVDGFDRQVVVTDNLAQEMFRQLVAGPTDAEQAAGASSFFAADTSDTVRSVTLDGGLLVVDFEDLRPLIPNASTSCGSAALLAQLNATAFQDPDVLSVRYEIVGDCDAFANWLQGECQEFERES